MTSVPVSPVPINTVPVKESVGIKKILYLTDFSGPSQVALPIAVKLARQYGGSIEVVHVLTPMIPEACLEAVQADEELAAFEMKRIESRIAGAPFTGAVVHESSVWNAVERIVSDDHIDLIVTGTHGRTGVPKLLLGSVAEEVFRRSPIPVVTVGPHVHAGNESTAQDSSVLFATDFSSGSEAAVPYAFSLAGESRARLILLHVMRESEPSHPSEFNQYEKRVAVVIEQLRRLAPGSSGFAAGDPAEVRIEHGDPADRILAVAKERKASLIVLGVRGVEHVNAITHLELAVAHKVVALAHCPVLTVRAQATIL
jgi:nucleotide-binding universal stress UspA family protein